MKYEFDKNRKRILECPCGKNNNDGKFIAFKGYISKGYCYSCCQLIGLNNEEIKKILLIPSYEKPKPISTINNEILIKTLCCYENNNFIQFLYSKFEKSKIDEIINLYKIGSSKKGTVFWQIDIYNNIRAAKIIKYNKLNGKRDKTINPSWVHTEIPLKDYVLTQCFYGEHLISKNLNNIIGIVESEKTAIVASLYYPDITWIATGGKMGLSINKLEVLKNRRIIIFPDTNAFGYWTNKLEDIKKYITKECYINSFLQNNATENEIEEGIDIVDYLLENKMFVI
jgi:hypothetical protein